MCARVENVCVRADGYEFAAANRSDLPANGGGRGDYRKTHCTTRCGGDANKLSVGKAGG